MIKPHDKEMLCGCIAMFKRFPAVYASCTTKEQRVVFDTIVSSTVKKFLSTTRKYKYNTRFIFDRYTIDDNAYKIFYAFSNNFNLSLTEYNACVYILEKKVI